MESPAKVTFSCLFMHFTFTLTSGPSNRREQEADSDASKIETSLSHSQSTNAADCQGTLYQQCHAGVHTNNHCRYFQDTPEIPRLVMMEKEDETTKTVCNKDTSEKKRIQKWTRGVWMSVSGGGIIQSWQPLYKYV